MILIKNLDSSVGEINSEQINEICNIYSKNLSSDILPNFGYDTLKNYFKFMIKNNADIIIASKNNLILGFLVLRFNKIDLKKIISIKSICIFIFKSLTNPLLLIRLIFQIFKKDESPDTCSEIHAFAVKKEFSSQGIGKMLINEAQVLTRNKNYRGIFTKTHNERLFKYYEREKKINLIKKFKILNRTYYQFYWNI